MLSLLLFWGDYPKSSCHWACRMSVANIWLIRASEMAPKTGILARYWVTPHNTEIVQKPSSHAGLRVIARHHALCDIKRLWNLLSGSPLVWIQLRVPIKQPHGCFQFFLFIIDFLQCECLCQSMVFFVFVQLGDCGALPDISFCF